MKSKQDEIVSRSEAASVPASSLPSSKRGRSKGWLIRWFVHHTFTARFLAPPLRHPTAGYLVAVILQGGALALTVLLTTVFPMFRFPGALFLLGTLLIALGWGALPAIVATLIGTVLLAFFLFPPYFSLALVEVGDLLGIMLYTTVGLTISILASKVQRARQQAELLAVRLDSILQAIPDPVLLYDTQGRPTQFNRASQMAYTAPFQNVTLAESLPQLNIRSIDGKPLAADRTPLARALRGESIVGEEIYYRAPLDQCDYVASVSAAPIHSADGSTIEGVVVVSRDLTERIHAQEEQARLLYRALRSEYRFQRLFDANLIGLVIADNERIVEANDAFLTMLGYSRADLEAGLMNWHTMTPPEYVSLDKQAINDLVTSGEVSAYEKEYVRKDGSRIPILMGGTIVEQEPLAWLYFVLDLSERNRLERETRARATELETLFEAITDGIMVYDASGRIIQLNTTARMQLSRYLTPEAFQRSVYERAMLVKPQSVEGARFPVEQIPAVRILRGETIAGAAATDVHITTFNGEDLWLNMSGTPLRDEQGKITGAISIARDVTERRKLEQRTRTALEALLEMAQVLVQGVENMPEITTDTPMDSPYSRQIVQRLAELTRKVLGCQRLAFTQVEPETELLRPLAVVGLSPQQEEQWWREQREQEVHLSDPGSDPVMVARLRANEVLLIDMTQPPYDKAPNPYAVRQMLAAPMVLDNRLLGFLTLDYGGIDHTYTPEEISLTKAVTRLAALAMERDRLLIEAAQSRANELAALAANQLKDEFIGVAGHELRTPLTSMKMNVQLATRQLRRQLAHYNSELAEAATNGEVDDTIENAETQDGTGKVSVQKEIIEILEQQLVFLGRTRRQLDLQNRLIQDLLDVSRLERGHLELRLTEFDLAALVREVVSEQQDITPNRRLLLDFLHPDEEVLVNADRDRISQVISNYLSNALKYSDADKPVSVCVEQVPGSQQARVSVKDQGPGLSQEEQQRIWERFYRAPSIEVRSGSGVGLGLGLSISRTLIEQHNGRIGVESEEGKGSTFWFMLPLLQ